MKHMYLVSFLSILAIHISFPVLAENLFDVVEEAQKTIVKKYPSDDSIARKHALTELDEIVSRDISETQKIDIIKNKFLSTPLSNVQSSEDKPESSEEKSESSEDDFAMLLKRADQGDAKAQSKLGIAYYEGDGISKNYNEAI